MNAVLAARSVGLLGIDAPYIVTEQPELFEVDVTDSDVMVTQLRRDSFKSKIAFLEALGDILAPINPDWIFLTFDWLLPSKIVERYADRILNLHMAMLPAFPGQRAIERAFHSTLQVGGVTIHFVDEGMDTGRIIAQASVPIASCSSLEAYGRTLFMRSVPLTIQVLRWQIEGRIILMRSANRIAIKNSHFDNGPYFPSIDKDIIDFSQSYLADYF